MSVEDKVLENSILRCLGLKCLHSAGWVHRDISMGNLLLCGDICKISDLEHALPYNDPNNLSHHEFKFVSLITPLFWPFSRAKLDTFQGTPAFMAVEIQMTSALYPPIRDPSPMAETYEERVRQREEKAAQRKHRDEKDPSTSMFAMHHNYLHDLESMYWLVLWFICHTIPHDLEVPQKDLQNQYNRLSNLFPCSLHGDPVRNRFIRFDYKEYRSYLRFLPDASHKAAKAWYGAMETIRIGYRKFERNNPQDFFGKSFVSVYDEVLMSLDYLKDFALERVVPLPRYPNLYVVTLHLLDDDAPAPTKSLASRGQKRKARSEGNSGEDDFDTAKRFQPEIG